MKEGKASRAMKHLDDELILSAMDDSDIKGKKAAMISGGNDMKNTMWKKWLSIAAAFAVILSAVIITGGLLAGGYDAVIALDVNPGIEIEIDKNEEVKSVRATTSDAQVITGELSLEGLKLDGAVEMIIDSMVKNGYISKEQNSILVSVDSASGRYEKKLKDRLTGDINLRLGNSSIEASVIAQSFDKNGAESQMADENNISTGKAALIARIVKAGLLDARGVPYSYETLAGLKVNELKVILESKDMRVDGIKSVGTASTEGYITAEAAIEAALEDAGVARGDIGTPKHEMDYDDDYNAMVHEVEFVYGTQKYEYEILAKSGEIVEREQEPARGDEGQGVEAALPKDAITREAALEAVYAHARIDAQNVKRPKIELDREDGVYVYEIEFKVGGMEYEYTVNAANGKILEHEAEPID